MFLTQRRSFSPGEQFSVGRPHPTSNLSWKTTTSLGVLRNHIASEALGAVQKYLQAIHHKKKLQTVESRATYIDGLFNKEDDHLIIWREYVEGDIQNHPEIGGYKTVCGTLVPSPSSLIATQTRRGVFQSDPILAALLGYYSSFGIMEDPPTEDPGPGNRPMGILALASAAVSYYSQCLPGTAILTRSLGRFTALTRCTKPAILSTQASGLTQTPVVHGP